MQTTFLKKRNDYEVKKLFQLLYFTWKKKEATQSWLDKSYCVSEELCKEVTCI